MTIPYLQLRGVTHIGDSEISEQIEDNLKMLLDWTFLNTGGWFDNYRNTSGVYGGNTATLRKVNDPSYTDGLVWEGNRKDWVWEGSASYTDPMGSSHEPIQISGVYINGNITATGYYIDYPNGRVVFDTVQTGPIEVEYSARYIQVLTATRTPWFMELQYNSLRRDDTTFSTSASGAWGQLAQQRGQMPLIVVESVPRQDFTPYELGSLAQWFHRNVNFNILAETKAERDRLIDILSRQQDMTFWLFNTNLVDQSGAYPLDDNGNKVNNHGYQDLVSPTGYRLNNFRVERSYSQSIDMPTLKLYRGLVRWTIEGLEGCSRTFCQ